ncbi:hypothetical protein QZH41_019511, partial [Actinostola sp. cb2023]
MDAEMDRRTDGSKNEILTLLTHYTESALHFRSPSKVLQDVCEIKPLSVGGLNVSEFRLLLIGQVGSGKSSFYNTINSIFRGYVTSQAITGNAGRSVTTMVDGNIPNRFQFSPYGGITPDSPGFIEAPTHSQRAHCVALVLDAANVDNITDAMWQKYRMFQDAVNARRVPMVVLLTKIDLACPQTQENLLHVFHSQRIQQIVRMVSTKLQGLPTNKIFPIKNYEWETELNMHVNSLSLLALRQMLRFAQDYIEDKTDYLREAGILRSRMSAKELTYVALILIALLCCLYVAFSGKLFTMMSSSSANT